MKGFRFLRAFALLRRGVVALERIADHVDPPQDTQRVRRRIELSDVSRPTDRDRVKREQDRLEALARKELGYPVDSETR